jgi:uncharacterized protein
MPITALYAALLTPVLLFLTFRVIGYRRSNKVEIGDGNDRELLRRMRVHANFVETVPMALILLGLAESLKASGFALHGLGGVLLIGRVVHAYGLSQTPHIMPLRAAGMVMTIIALAGGAALCFAMVVFNRGFAP